MVTARKSLVSQQFEIWIECDNIGAMNHDLTLDAFIQRLKSKNLTDKRTGKNVQYEVNDAAQAAFAIFFMQSGSFLAGQRHLRQAKGKSNAETVFQM